MAKSSKLSKSELNKPTKMTKPVDGDLVPKSTKMNEQEAKDVLGGVKKMGAVQMSNL